MDQIYNKDLLNEILDLKVKQNEMLEKLSLLERQMINLASTYYPYAVLKDSTNYTSTLTNNVEE